MPWTSPRPVPLAAVALAFAVSTLAAEPLTCSFAGYTPSPGLTATSVAGALLVTWQGEAQSELRMRLGIDGARPIIRELAIRTAGAPWRT